ncbi:MAG: hypothetical protein DSY80_06845 [Desulfocapsa sp.]|nr:MAG: hypothetical protein DSY80_06845 [Desulfocapsa sp.]
MQIKSHEIGFDFDGVIANTGETFLQLACEEFGHCSFSLDDIRDFEVEDCLGIPKEHVEQLFYTIMIDSLKSGLQPMPGALDVIAGLAEQSTVTIITARPLTNPVSDWLDHFCTPETCNKIKLVATSDHNDKSRYIKEHNLRFFIDDRVETCLQLAETDITPIVYNQPWNKGRHSLQNVSNWQEITTLLEGL